jgi:hypothetical protein
MSATTCEHAETAVTLYRIDGELLCLDCLVDRYRQLDEREANALRFLEELRAERELLISLVGYSPAGTSRLVAYMETDSAEEKATNAYAMTVVDPDGFTRRLHVEADSEEAARASGEIRAFERVVEVSTA